VGDGYVRKIDGTTQADDIAKNGIRMGGPNSKQYAADGLLIPNDGEPVTAQPSDKKPVVTQPKPVKKARVYVRENDAVFNKEAKRSLPLLEQKYGKGNVQIFQIPQGNQKLLQAKLAEEAGNDQEAFDLRKQADEIELGILKGQTLEEAQKSVDAQEKFNLALERAKEIFTDVIDGGLLDGLVDALGDIVIYLERLGFGDKEVRLSREREKIKGKLGENYNEEATKELQEIANPGFWEGILDSLIGGINPMYAATNDMEQGMARAAIKGTINADDFTVRTHPKDELVIAGGTNLSGGSNQEMIGLLQKLVSATEQSRQVTVAVDGEAIFSAMGKIPMK
jgi:hypothetical protein